MKKIYVQFLYTFFFLSAIFFSLKSDAISDSLITTNSSWKYLDNGSNQGTAWRAIAFNDAAWVSGIAELGYGDGDETTVVSFGPSSSNKYITTYFRKSFTVVNASLYTSLTFGLVRDDGAIIYLNGTEVYRANMPAGSVNFKTKASSDITGTNESAFNYFTITSTLLVTGVNNVSVEIHQFDKTSPDISFKLNLAALQVSPCNTPAGLNTTNVTTTSALLNWNAVSGALSYNIQYRIIGNPTWSTTTSTTTSATISSLTPSANYEWRVQSDCGSSNLSAFSALDNFTTATPPPCNTPTGLTTTNVTITSALLNWNAVSGALSYNIQYRIIGNPTWSTTTSATASVTISSLTPSANYEWQVQSDCGSSNLSAFSALANFTTATPPCGTPTGLIATNITTTSALLTWNSVSGALGYNIQYRVIGNPTWSTTTSATASVTISSLIPSANYEWQVQSDCGSSNLSAFSALANFTTATPPCGTPTGLIATNITTTSALLTWNSVSGALGYNIKHRVIGNPTWSTTTSATASVTISSLIPSANYEWQVQSDCGSSNLSVFSALANFTTATPPCGTPTGLIATNITTTSALLTWNSVGGALGYNIQYRVIGNPTWSSATSVTTSVIISSLTPSANYQWQVQSDCGSSNLSAFSALANFTTATPPPCITPTGLNTTNITATSAMLNWSPAIGALSYNIQYRIIGNPIWSTAISITTSVMVSSLSISATYEWCVQSNCGSSNLSAFSTLAYFTTATPVCSTPTGLTTTSIATTSATLNWLAVIGAFSYNVQYRIVGAPSWTNSNILSTSLSINSLSPASNYEWQVQAVCGLNQSLYSSMEYFTTAAQSCPLPVGMITHSISNTFAVFRWNAVPGASSYNVHFRVVGAPIWIHDNTVQLYYDFTGLSPSTDYEWQVQTVCLSGVSPFTSILSFRTLINDGIDSLITLGDEWKYLDKGYDAVGWTLLGFNDSTWSNGISELGYGDGDEATVVGYGPDSNFKYITTYFRKVFDIMGPADYSTMLLDVVRDDGVIVYVNGTEVYRNNMPLGPATYNTFASTAISVPNESAWYSSAFSPSLLVNGHNIIAAEIHQVSQTSSDISFNLRLTGNGVATKITRGPYLQMMTQNSVIASWRTLDATSSRIRYGLTPTDRSLMVYDSTVTTEHAVRLTGLNFASRYYYTIETGTYFLEGDSTYTFLTQPENGPYSLVQIWALGDFGNGSSGQLATRNAFRNDPDYSKTNLFLWLGDNAYSNGTDSEYQTKVFDIYQRELRKFPLFPSPGNHDYANVGYLSSTALTTNFPYYNIVRVPTAAEAGGLASGTEKYYSFNYYNIHFVSLDSYGALNNLSSPMYNWLRNDLDANTQRWTIVYFHHPPYTMGSHNSDTEIESINMRQNILPLLESHHVDLVLNGHSHVNERSYLIKGHYGSSLSLLPTMILQGGSGSISNPYIKVPPYDGTVYAVCGTGGQLSSTVQGGFPMSCMYFSDYSDNCSLVIDVNSTQLDCRFLSASGTNLDQFRIVKIPVRENQTSGTNDILITAYPSPFTEETNISYSLERNMLVRLELFNMMGEKVYSFTDGNQWQTIGRHQYKLSSSTSKINQGIYFVSLQADGITSFARIVLLK